jgi:hypothetical protein
LAARRVGLLVGLLVEAHRSVSPCAEPADLAYEWSGEAGPLLRAHERKDGAGNHRHVASADQLEHAQRMLHFLIAPGIAGHHGNAEHVDVRRLQQHHHRHLVGSAGTGTILVDEHKTFLRKGRWEKSQQ